jgi:hypothetical protein
MDGTYQIQIWTSQCNSNYSVVGNIWDRVVLNISARHPLRPGHFIVGTNVINELREGFSGRARTLASRTFFNKYRCISCGGVSPHFCYPRILQHPRARGPRECLREGRLRAAARGGPLIPAQLRNAAPRTRASNFVNDLPRLRRANVANR